jgi:lipopolysaccharide/colanic/teichoic acid biosynthesis glycosyltransferase
MTNEHDEHGQLLPDSQRLTSFGRFLRATSIDELPSLWNVLKGEMSLVGPRPLSMKYLPYYTEVEKLRHSVKPGILGLAQVNGRNALSWAEKFRLDVEYVNNYSFKMDLAIIGKGVLVVLGRKNVGQGEEQPESLDDMRQNNEFKHNGVKQQ